jgi:hypothetical protein
MLIKLTNHPEPLSKINLESLHDVRKKRSEALYGIKELLIYQLEYRLILSI